MSINVEVKLANLGCYSIRKLGNNNIGKQLQDKKLEKWNLEMKKKNNFIDFWKWELNCEIVFATNDWGIFVLHREKHVDKQPIASSQEISWRTHYTIFARYMRACANWSCRHLVSRDLTRDTFLC